MKRLKRNYNRSYARTVPSKQSDGKTFLIVVEGKQTERLYFDEFRKRLELKAADVVIEHAGATDPQNMVTTAVTLRDKRAEAAKKSVLLAPYDEVWVVFDREATHHVRGKQLPAAISKAAEEEISVALSNPSFEFWLLLHYVFTTKPFSDAQAVIRELKKHIPKYKKRLFPLDELFALLRTAIKNASACLAHHKAAQGDGNPSTEAHLLVTSLNNSAAPVFRLISL